MRVARNEPEARDTFLQLLRPIMSSMPVRVEPLVQSLTNNGSLAQKSKESPVHFSLAKPRDDDIVIVSGCRSAITKAKKGGLSSYKADQILAEVLKDLVKKTPQIKFEDIGDMVIGSVLQPGGGQAMVRVAMFEAGFPYKIPVASINRQCASGLEAVASVVGHIAAGDYNVGIAGGVESMSSTSFQNATPVVDTKSVKAEPNAAACMIPMGVTSDNIANRYQISRTEQDRYALKSHRKAETARKEGKFAKEMVMIGKALMDDGIRPSTSLEALLSLNLAFSKPPVVVPPRQATRLN